MTQDFQKILFIDQGLNLQLFLVDYGFLFSEESLRLGKDFLLFYHTVGDRLVNSVPQHFQISIGISLLNLAVILLEDQFLEPFELLFLPLL